MKFEKCLYPARRAAGFGGSPRPAAKLGAALNKVVKQ